MTEKNLQKKIVKYAKDRGVLAYKFSSPARRGVPDLILVGKRGQVVFMELKNPNEKGRLSELQKYTHPAIAQSTLE